MYKRIISLKISELAKQYPVLTLTGPRQSGKTTLLKECFAKTHQYVLLEDPDMRRWANEDPRGFLSHYAGPTIIDEAQYAPELFNYMQGIVDQAQQPGQYILSGSQHFLLLEKITQSLAGRVAILELLPLSLAEMTENHIRPAELNDLLFQGQYPRIYHQHLSPRDWYKNYVQTYLERDVRQLKNVHDLGVFQTFLYACAGRVGQLLDLTSLGNDCGVSYNTIKAWINILEASFIIYRLQPYYKNFNKRLIKSPKLYFYDSGLLCYLLGIQEPKQIENHFLKGGIFETWVISEMYKNAFNSAKDPRVYFWRDKSQREVDCLVDSADGMTAIEIKSGKTISGHYVENLDYLQKIAETTLKHKLVVYAGDSKQTRQNVVILPWNEFLM